MKDETLKKFVALKAQSYKTLYYQQYRGLEIIFRPLSFGEYKLISEMEKHLNGALINDILIRFTVLYISDFDNIENWLNECKAGYPDFLAQKILDVSGFQNKEHFLVLLKQKREDAKQLQSLIQIYICTAFHSIKPSDIDDMSLDEQLDLFCKAEEAIGKPVDIEAIMTGKQNKNIKGPPVPPGFQTTDPEAILSKDSSSKPNWEHIKQGIQTY